MHSGSCSKHLPCLPCSLVFPALLSSLLPCPPCPQSAEVWYEVAGELAQEGLRPVTPDQETLQEVLHSHEEKAEQTLRLQVGGRGGGRERERERREVTLSVCYSLCSLS